MDDDDIQFDADLPITHADTNNSRDANNNQNHNPEDGLSPLEREVLDEYARLVGNLDDVCPGPRPEICQRSAKAICGTPKGVIFC